MKNCNSKQVILGKRTTPWSISEDNSGPSKKLPKSKNWEEQDNEGLKSSGSFALSKAITGSSFEETFIKSWKENKCLTAQDCELIQDPFKSAVVQNFISEDNLIKTLVDEMTTMEWTRKQMDLYEFHQSTDLANVESGLLKEFHEFLNDGEFSNLTLRTLILL